MVSLTADTQLTVNAVNTSIFEGSMGTPLQEIVITNVSAGGQRISLSFSETQPAVDGYGVVLEPGMFYADSSGSGHEIYSGRIYAFSKLAGGLLAIHIRS